jgi:transposase
MKQSRRKYSAEFKQEAVQLVTMHGYTVAQAAESLGIRENMLWRWKKEQAKREATAPEAEAVEAELQRLRKENQRLRMERDILKKATAFFSNEPE